MLDLLPRITLPCFGSRRLHRNSSPISRIKLLERAQRTDEQTNRLGCIRITFQSDIIGATRRVAKDRQTYSEKQIFESAFDPQLIQTSTSASRHATHFVVSNLPAISAKIHLAATTPHYTLHYGQSAAALTSAVSYSAVNLLR